ncbi:MAG: DUF4010 domain-containing protein [Gammaproteobacteria bacterium]
MFDLQVVPPLLTQFVLTAAFSFVIGLELHGYRRANRPDLGFGTTRTFTLIGILGFVLYALDDHGLLYAVGLLGLLGFLWIYYARHAAAHASLLTPLIGVLTYLVGPAIMGFPGWFPVLFVVTLLLMLGEKPGIRRLSDTFHSEEMVTLAKFLIMAGVVLPLLPDRQIASFVTVTYYQVWLALLLVSGLSYASYLAQAYFFRARGLLLTGLLGGLYSSTAATVVIGRRARELAMSREITPALILATTMMYLRLLILVAALGHGDAAARLLVPFGAFVATSLAAAWFLSRGGSARVESAQMPAAAQPLKHPLEVTTATVFALLFVAFAAITHAVIARFGTGGLHALSVFVGFTDIDPFVLSLLAGKFHVSVGQLTGAIIVASGSNNLLKAGYALALGRNRSVVPAALWLVALFAASLAYAYLAA